jgi:3-hydroxybutyryl-CoA dehydrogenase
MDALREPSPSRLGVVGAGTMGTGVSQAFAEGGHQVVLVDVDPAALRRARDEIAAALRLAPLLRPSTEGLDVDAVLGRIEPTEDLDALVDADYVVENVTEKWETKAEVYPELDRICGEGCILGVNTSAIPITRIASLTSRPEQVIGTHFMNPAPLKPTVEVIRGFHTSEETIETTRRLLATIGKNAIVVADSPGFVTNRVMMLTVNEAMFLVHEGVAPAREIDRLFKECFGHKMGPLETADLIGLDTVLYSLEVLHGELQDPKFRPCPLLRRLVDAGLHGKKSGRGFYEYVSPLSAPVMEVKTS